MAWTLAVAYLLVVVYASVQPARGWRIPPAEVLNFLGAPWPRYVTFDDLLLNVLAYVPAGFLLALALRPHVRQHLAALLAILAGVALSIALEYVQTFLPGRVASNVDVLTNSFGAVVGALAAPLFGPTRQLGKRLFVWRDRWFASGMLADTGVVLVALWMLTALHPTAQLFGTGDWRSVFDLPVRWLHTPQLALAAEATVVALNLIGLGLLVATLARHRAGTTRLITAAVLFALALKTVAATGVKTPTPWNWLTPGVTLGLLVGAALLYPLLRVPRRVAAAAGACAIALAVAVINLAPSNPYLSVPRVFLAGGASHFLSYSGIVRTLSQVWPVLALVFLLAVVGGAGRTTSAGAAGDRL